MCIYVYEKIIYIGNKLSQLLPDLGENIWFRFSFMPSDWLVLSTVTGFKKKHII